MTPSASLRPAVNIGGLLIAGTALLAVGTLVVRGNSCGHDFDFHLLSWMEVARAWHAGLIYPHWVQDANYGAGEPRLIFYPPISWLLGALLGAIFGWHAAPVLFVLLALSAAGSSMYLLALFALGMWIAERRPWPGLRAAGGITLGLGLAAFYIVPAAFEQR